MVNMHKRVHVWRRQPRGEGGYLSKGKRVGHGADEDLTQFAAQV